MPEHRPASDEFYTGYLPEAPPGIARHVRRAVIQVLAVAAAVALALVFAQRGFPPEAVYEWGIIRDFEGVVRAGPYPTLELARPPGTGDRRSRAYLVAPGKFGAAGEVAELDGRRVRLRGSLVYRDDQTMIEVLPGSVEPIGQGAPAAAGGSLGVHTLVGRIVDSKCYLGVMKPGIGKPHRACAVRCISGGIPPIFLLSDERGPAAYLMLVGEDGRAVNREVLDLVDEPLEITGEVVRQDDLLVLRADPASYRRL